MLLLFISIYAPHEAYLLSPSYIRRLTPQPSPAAASAAPAKPQPEDPWLPFNMTVDGETGEWGPWAFLPWAFLPRVFLVLALSLLSFLPAILCHVVEYIPRFLLYIYIYLLRRNFHCFLAFNYRVARRNKLYGKLKLTLWLNLQLRDVYFNNIYINYSCVNICMYVCISISRFCGTKYHESPMLRRLLAIVCILAAQMLLYTAGQNVKTSSKMMKLKPYRRSNLLVF